jgi:hypothetical protein
VGSNVSVFLGQSEDDPQSGDLPAIILADPGVISMIGFESISVNEILKSGANTCAAPDSTYADSSRTRNTRLAERHDAHSLKRQLDKERDRIETNERFMMQNHQDSPSPSSRFLLPVPEEKDRRPSWVPDILLLPFNT